MLGLCKKNATFHFVGRPFIIKYNYLCKRCYYDLAAEPKNYMKINYRIYNPYNYGIVVMLMGPSLLIGNKLCEKCVKCNATYKLIG